MKSAAIGIVFIAAALAAGTTNVAAANRQLVGGCTCKKGGSTLATYSATACVKSDHAGCTSVKVQCVNENATACSNMGGTISQSVAACTGYNDKC